VGFCPFHSNTNTPSLVVFPDTGTWHCFGACNEGGTVIDWVLKQNPGWGVGEAVKHLAQKANIPMEKAGEGALKERVAARAQEDTLKVTMGLFKRWLLEDAEALAYARDRGWTDETIKASGIGFSGRATTAQVKEMKGEFSMHGIEPLSPQAVMILGFKGDVAAWAQAHGIEPKSLPEDHVHGMMGAPGIVYAHKIEGRVRYMSRRQLPGFDKTKDGNEWKSFNPYTALAGERLPFFNWLHRFHYTEGKERGERIVIVEGQGDAVAWGQFGAPAMALCGSSWRSLVESGVIEQIKAEYKNITYCTDADTPGEAVVIGKKKDFPLSTAFGGMLWVARMPRGSWKRPDGSEKALKDANDLAQWIRDRKINERWQKCVVQDVLARATPIVLEAARYAGKQKGQFFSNVVREVALPLIVHMPIDERNHYSSALAEALYPGKSKTEQGAAFRKLIGDEIKSHKNDDDDTRLEEVSTFGCWLPLAEDPQRGWLIDYIYDPVTAKAQLAYRNPQGEIGTANHLDIDGKRYVPRLDEFVQKSVVVFPAALGTLKTTAELLFIHETHHRRSFLVDRPSDYKMASYYSVFSWVYDCFNELPFLRARGGKDTGKSAIMLRIGYICYRLSKSTGIGSTASLKHAQELYKGCIYMDEMDIADKFDERIVMLNVSAMKDQAFIWSMKPVSGPEGETLYEPQAHNVYGPKLITMYGSFADEATESRCITFELFGKDMAELKAQGIPRRLNAEWHRQALLIRNMSLHWRLKHWRPNIDIPDDLEDDSVSTRANQVTVPIKFIVKDDPVALAEVTAAVREMYEDEILERAQSFPARFLEAIVSLLEAPRFMKLNFVFEGELKEHGHAKYVRYPDLAKVVNFLLDEMNTGVERDPEILIKAEAIETGEAVETGKTEEKVRTEKGKKKKRKEEEGVSSKTVGNVVRKDLRLPVARLGSGYVVIVWSQSQPAEVQDRIVRMRSKFGLDVIQQNAGKTAEQLELERYEAMAEQDEPDEPDEHGSDVLP
jgi:hypothetical protein